MRGWLAGWPLQIGLLLSPAQLARVRELVAGRRYDMAYAYYIRSAEALREARRARPDLATFMALQLSQTLNTERLARTAATPWDRLFYRFETRRMADYEARLWRDVTRTVLIGEQDRAAIAGACRERGLPEIDNVVWGPHGVDVERFRPRPEAEEADMVVMSGVMRYAPNVEAALWFAREVWPLVRAARPAARFFLVGRDPAAALQALRRQGRDHRHRHGRGAGRLDRPGRRLRGADPRRRGPAEQAARGHGDGQGGGRDARGQRGHRGARGRGAAARAGARARSRDAVLALLARPEPRRRAGRRRPRLRRGEMDLGRPVPGARAGVPRRVLPALICSCDVRPQVLCCTAQ